MRHRRDVIAFANGNWVDAKSPAGAIETLLLFGFEDFGALVLIAMGLTAGFALLFLVVLFVFPQAVHGNPFGFGDRLAHNLLLQIGTRPEPVMRGTKPYTVWRYAGVVLGRRHFAYLCPLAVEYIAEELRADIVTEKAPN